MLWAPCFEKLYSTFNRDINKGKKLLVCRTSDRIRMTCPPTFSLVQKIMHRSTQNYKFRENMHTNKTKPAASCNRLQLFIAKFSTCVCVGEGGGHSRIPRHVRAPYYWRQPAISGLETVSQGGPQPKHRPPDFDICLYSHK